MTVLHILNPAAGKGKLPDPSTLDGEIYTTRFIGDASEYLKSRLSDGDEYVIYAYGGDGTQNEVVNGIMAAGAGSRCIMIPVPTGSGNDLYKLTGVINNKFPCDLIKYNEKYAVNVLNIGFDCGVVVRTNNYKKKKFISGPTAYILGVVSELIHKHPTRLTLHIINDDGEEEVITDDLLLCAIANGRYYGGGFMAAPVAEINDGLLDIVIIKNASALRFISLVKSYKNGDHIDPETMEPADKFKPYITFRRCRKITVEGVGDFCADGELFDANGTLSIENIPSAVYVSGQDYESKQPEPALV